MKNRRSSPAVVALIALVALPGVLSQYARAADKSGVEANVISLPGGPGSIEGLGESYQPNLNSGTPGYGITVDVPPGPAGAEPQVAVTYEGGGPNGPLGFGWSFDIPFIQRQCDEGIPRYVDAENGVDDDGDLETDEADERDVFINASREELVPLANGDFFCKNEGAFIRYRRVGNAWAGTLPDGTSMQFGVSETARVQDDSGRVYRWLCETVTDTHGNVTRYSHSGFTGDANLNQKYCRLIEYGPGAPPWTNFHFVAFSYEDRADWFEDCRAGFRVRTGKRMARIDVGTQGPLLPGHQLGDFNDDSLPDHLNRRYVLDYLTYAGTNTHWSFLGRVQMIGADGVSTLPATTFDYAVCTPPDTVVASPETLSAANEPEIVMDSDKVDLLDINADGLPDILCTPGGGSPHLAYINEGEVVTNGALAIRWSDSVEVASDDELAWQFDLQSVSGSLATLADMDGDGVADLVYYEESGDTVHYFKNLSTNVAWGSRQDMSTQDVVPPSPLGNPTVGMADIDFDKRIDIIRTVNDGFDYQVWFNMGEQVYSRRFTESQDEGFMLGDVGVALVDFNGDRVPDFTSIRTDSVEVTAGLGYGTFAPKIRVFLPDWTLDANQREQARLRDINGDGLVDLVIERAGAGELWYWLNLGNYTFSARRKLTGMPATIGPDAVTRWADMNGNGTTDLVYADSAADPRITVVEIGRLIGCGPDMNMMTQVRNGLGLTTTYEYDLSTRLAVDDREAGRPWPDVMPFPMTVVTRIIEDDSLGHRYESQYRYHNGFYDETEKEFRGFGRVERIDVGDETAPALVTESIFDQGKQYEALQGCRLRLTVKEEDGDVFSETITTWVDPPRVLHSGDNGEEVVYAFPLAETNVIPELGRGTPRVLVSEFEYDNYGNVTREANYGVVEGGDRAAFDDERVTETTYAINTNLWIVQAPVRTEVMDEHGVVISRTEIYYDDPTFAGGNLGEVTVGDVTLTRAWIDPSALTNFIRASRTQYDSFGNPVILLDPLSPDGPDPSAGHYREVAYDADFRAYAERETIHVGNSNTPLRIQAAYDQGFGVVTNAIDMNGYETAYGYDTFSRLVDTVRPGDSEAFPTMEYDYAMAVPVGASGLVSYVESRVLDKAPGSAGGIKGDHYFISRRFFDGLGRLLMTKQEAGRDSGDDEPRIAVKVAVTFNARKGIYQQLNPYYSVTNAAGGGFEFEAIESAGWSGLFHDSAELVELGLADAHKKAVHYDAQGRRTRAFNADGTYSEMAYEPLVTRVFDENDSDSASPHFQTPSVSLGDGLGRTIRTDRWVRIADDGTPSGILTNWSLHVEYDLNDMQTAVTDAQGNTKRMRYDGLTRMLSREDPDQGTVTFAYDDASHLIERRDARGLRITYTYDGVNRLRTEDYHDEGLASSFNRIYDPAKPVSVTNQPDVLYVYETPVADLDLGDGSVATARNTRGRVAGVVDLSGEEHTSYDERGRIEYQVKRVPDPEHGQLVSYTTRQRYDSMDRVVALVYPDNDVIQYAYNDRALTARIFGDRAGDILSSIAYTPFDAQQDCQYGNGVITRRTFDKRLRMNALFTGPATNVADALVHMSYRFDKSSNIEAIDDLRAHFPATNVLHNTQAFQYDDLYRLVRYQLTDPAHSAVRGILNYRYDRIGNMLYRSSPANGQPGHLEHDEAGRSVVNIGAMSCGGAAGTTGRGGHQPGDPPGPGALTATADGRLLAYDDNGNVSVLDGMTNTWDCKDRLVVAENAVMRAEYTYDYSDRRIRKKVVTKGETVGASHSLTTRYVNRGFEVREHEQPTKFVHNGGTRVARITRSVSSVSNRVQRLRVQAGWNLLSMAVQTPAAAGQLGIGIDSTIEGCYRWVPETHDYAVVDADGPLPAGSVFWLKSTSNQVLEVSGLYSDPTNQAARAGGDYIPGPGLEGYAAGAGIPGEIDVWTYDSEKQGWRSRRSPSPPGGDRLPEWVPPGGAVFVNMASALQFQMSEPARQIQYYHHDHLGSSSVITGPDGGTIEEVAFYPFGQPRHVHRTGSTDANYLFTQKEKDRETGLDYFGARYYAAPLARWLSVDPSADLQPGLTPFHYVENRPLTQFDPDGKLQSKAGKDVHIRKTPLGRANSMSANHFGGLDKAGKAWTGRAKGATLWSGGKVVGGKYRSLETTAGEAAKMRGGHTLEATFSSAEGFKRWGGIYHKEKNGKEISELHTSLKAWDNDDPSTHPAWLDESARLAEGASGKVRAELEPERVRGLHNSVVVVDGKETPMPDGGVFWRIEYPRVIRNSNVHTFQLNTRRLDATQGKSHYMFRSAGGSWEGL